METNEAVLTVRLKGLNGKLGAEEIYFFKTLEDAKAARKRMFAKRQDDVSWAMTENIGTYRERVEM